MSLYSLSEVQQIFVDAHKEPWMETTIVDETNVMEIKDKLISIYYKSLCAYYNIDYIQFVHRLIPKENVNIVMWEILCRNNIPEMMARDIENFYHNLPYYMEALS